MTVLCGLVLVAGCSPAETRWDGADNLPTDPLACDATVAMRDADARAPPIGGPRTRGEPIDVAHVPKLTESRYFMESGKGIAEAARALGDVTAITDGPVRPDINEQIQTIERHIARGVEGILIAAIHPSAVAPVLRKAQRRGIHVVGYDADAEPDARAWFVNQAPPNATAKALVDSLAVETGDDAGFAIVTSTFSTPNQARLIAEMSDYAATCHAGLRWLETVEAREDSALSLNQAAALIARHGADMKGIFGMTSVATPAAADAVSKAQECGQIAVVGLATPSAMKPYVEAGCVSSVVLWNPVDLGYAAAHVVRAAADGDLQPGATSVEAGRLGELRIVNGSEVLLGAPIVFTKDNIGRFDF